MSVFTVVSIVKNGQLDILGILEGAYGLSSAPADMPPEEVGDIFTNVITADSMEDAERAVRAKYLPEPDPDAGQEIPC